jgi:hypothetical protein
MCPHDALDSDIFQIYIKQMPTSAPKRGRPRKTSYRTKSESVLLRMDPGEKQGFADAAALAGIPLSVWIRERLRSAARKELGKVGQKPAFIDASL